jgi:hypothetical protein
MNEAKRLKLEKKDTEVREVMAYKAELQKIFERRYPDVVKIVSVDAKTRPLRFIRSIFKTQFFLNFLDFFDVYYLNLETKLHKVNHVFNSEFVSLHTVFVNFYHFLYAVRETVNSRIEAPHQFLLQRLEECMAYSSRPSSVPATPATELFCTFSDRKYSEMYYFYKFYLLINEKMDVNLHNFSDNMLNTHTRMFFIYAVNNKKFSQILDSTCAEEEYRWVDICISWVLFSDFYSLILDSTHRGSSFSFIRQFITERVLPNPNPQTANHVKFNVLFAAEAISLLVDGKGVNYSRFIALFNLDEQYALLHKDQAVVSEEDQKVLALFHIKKDDAENRELMIQYLKRTYFKKSRSSDETAITMAITSVIDESKANGAQDLLTMSFTYADHILVNYVKLFLMYASRDEHYAKIADFLIQHEVFFELANLNRPEDDLAYKSIIEKLALNDKNFLFEKKNGKQTSQFPHDVALYRSVLNESLRKRYKKILDTTSLKLMAMAQVNEQQNVEKSAEDFDIFSEFMEMGQQDVKIYAMDEEKAFDKVNKEMKLTQTNWQSNPSLSIIKITQIEKVDPNAPQTTRPQTGMTAETLAMMPLDATKMLQRAEQLEDKMIREEKRDFQNFGYSEQVIVEGQVERMAEKYHVEGAFLDTDVTTPTLMETLLTFGESVQMATTFLEEAQESHHSVSEGEGQEEKARARSLASVAPIRRTTLRASRRLTGRRPMAMVARRVRI